MTDTHIHAHAYVHAHGIARTRTHTTRTAEHHIWCRTFHRLEAKVKWILHIFVMPKRMVFVLVLHNRAPLGPPPHPYKRFHLHQQHMYVDTCL